MNDLVPIGVLQTQQQKHFSCHWRVLYSIFFVPERDWHWKSLKGGMSTLSLSEFPILCSTFIGGISMLIGRYHHAMFVGVQSSLTWKRKVWEFVANWKMKSAEKCINWNHQSSRTESGSYWWCLRRLLIKVNWAHRKLTKNFSCFMAFNVRHFMSHSTLTIVEFFCELNQCYHAFPRFHCQQNTLNRAGIDFDDSNRKKILFHMEIFELLSRKKHENRFVVCWSSSAKTTRSQVQLWMLNCVWTMGWVWCVGGENNYSSWISLSCVNLNDDLSGSFRRMKMKTKQTPANFVEMNEWHHI